MDIRVGWATDFGKEKFDVSMDGTDLLRIIGEVGLEPGDDALLSSSEVFSLLETTARWHAITEQRRISGTNLHERASQLALLEQERATVVHAIKVRLGRVASEPAATGATA